MCPRGVRVCVYIILLFAACLQFLTPVHSLLVLLGDRPAPAHIQHLSPTSRSCILQRTGLLLQVPATHDSLPIHRSTLHSTLCSLGPSLSGAVLLVIENTAVCLKSTIHSKQCISAQYSVLALRGPGLTPYTTAAACVNCCVLPHTRASLSHHHLGSNLDLHAAKSLSARMVPSSLLLCGRGAFMRAAC